MKWQGAKDTFSDGELRTRIKFSLLPVKLTNYKFVWLEYYFIDEQFFIPIAHGLVGFFPHFIILKKYQLKPDKSSPFVDPFAIIGLIIGFMLGLIGTVMCVMRLLK